MTVSITGSERYNKEHAEQKFARHVLGRILFLLQATNFVPPLTEGYLAGEKPENAKDLAKAQGEHLPRNHARKPHKSCF